MESEKKNNIKKNSDFVIKNTFSNCWLIKLILWLSKPFSKPFAWIHLILFFNLTHTHIHNLLTLYLKFFVQCRNHFSVNLTIIFSFNSHFKILNFYQKKSFSFIIIINLFMTVSLKKATFLKKISLDFFHRNSKFIFHYFISLKIFIL